MLPGRSARIKPTPSATPSSSTRVSVARTVSVQRPATSRPPAVNAHAAIAKTVAKLQPAHSNTSASCPAKRPPTAAEFEELKAEVEQLRSTVARLENEQSSMLLALFDEEEFRLKLRAFIATEIAMHSTIDRTSAIASTNTGELGLQSASISSPARYVELSWDPVLIRPSVPSPSRSSRASRAGTSCQAKRKPEEPEHSPITSVKRPRRDTLRDLETVTLASASASRPSTPSLQETALAEHRAVPQALHPGVDVRVSTCGRATPLTALENSVSLGRPAVDALITFTAKSASQAFAGGRTSPCKTSSDSNSQRESPIMKTLREAQSGSTSAVNSSPAREYMDVALNGLAGSCKSSSAYPSVRTMLGTERYRDTRFGDEPIVSWGSPSIIDFGPPTPVRDGVL